VSRFNATKTQPEASKNATHAVGDIDDSGTGLRTSHESMPTSRKNTASDIVAVRATPTNNRRASLRRDTTPC
jgi:hypothetical protein